MSFPHISRQSEQCHFLGALYQHELDDISKHLILKRVRKEQRFFPQQVGRKKIFAVVNGCVKIVEGKKLKFVALRGDFFGSVFGSGEGDYAQVISDDALIMIIDESNFFSWLNRHPRLRKTYFEKIEEKISEMFSWQLHMLRSNAKSRLLFLFKKMAAKEGKRTDNTVAINALTQENLAAIIFASRSTVSRLLKTLADEGKATRKAKAIQVYVGLNSYHSKAVA